MKNIQRRFEQLKQQGEKGLVAFVTAGDPDFDASRALIEKMIDAGVDVLELGVPFSDPTADGPTIQKASQRALKSGMTLKKVIELTTVLREKTDIPIILFSYYNPLLAYGLTNFYDDAVKAGADGVLLVDLPIEESDELTSKWPGDGLALIRLIAPTTPTERIEKIAASASGFLYLVSKTGVTGSDGLDTSEIKMNVERAKNITDIPVCVGFGISTPEDVKTVAASADGVVIGSAFERVIEENIGSQGLNDLIFDFTKSLKDATK